MQDPSNHPPPPLPFLIRQPCVTSQPRQAAQQPRHPVQHPARRHLQGGPVRRRSSANSFSWTSSLRNRLVSCSRAATWSSRRLHREWHGGERGERRKVGGVTKSKKEKKGGETRIKENGGMANQGQPPPNALQHSLTGQPKNHHQTHTRVLSRVSRFASDSDNANRICCSSSHSSSTRLVLAAYQRCGVMASQAHG